MGSLSEEKQRELNRVYLNQAARFLDPSWTQGNLKDAYNEFNFLLDLLAEAGIKWDSTVERKTQEDKESQVVE